MTTALFRAAAILIGSVALAACGHSNSGPSSAASASGDAGAAMSDATPAVAAALDIGRLTGAEESRACALDDVNGKGSSDAFMVGTDRASSFRGWAVDGNNAAPASMTLILKGAQTSYGLSAITGRSRPDVAKVLNSPEAESAGYEFKGDLKRVPAGTYQALVWVKDSAGNTLCDTDKQVVVEKTT